MGMYINTLNGKVLGASFMNKLEAITLTEGSRTTRLNIFVKDMVVLIDNGPFAALAYIDSKEELDRISNTDDSKDIRTKMCFVIPNAKSYVD